MSAPCARGRDRPCGRPLLPGSLNLTAPGERCGPGSGRRRRPMGRHLGKPLNLRTFLMLSIGSFASKIFGSSNDRRIKPFRARVDAINALEPELEKLSDEELRARTAEFREQLKNGKKLDDLLVPAFA